MNRHERMTNILNTDIYGITADEYSLGRGNVGTVSEMVASGIRVIQYREKEKGARRMYEECLEIRKITKAAGVTFIVNDHIDLGMAVGADGVHIGQEDLPPEVVRSIVGEDMIIGLSTHNKSQADHSLAISDVVDYIGVGPIFSTRTKKDVCQAVGLDYLEYVVQNIPMPFVAIGGVKEHNIGLVSGAGAKLISLVTEIVGASDIPAKVRALRAILK